MNKKAIIPALVVVSILTGATLYFEVFRHLGERSDILKGSGTLEVTEINISSKLAGRVIEIPFSEGSMVKKNDLLVRLDYEELSAQRVAANASLINAEKNFNRVSSLYKSGSISKKDFDNAKAAFEVAQANYEFIRANIGNAIITAPITGTILEHHLEPGEMAFPGTPILSIADLTNIWIKIYIPEPKLGLVKLGQNANIYIDSFPEKAFTGKIVQISDKAEFTPKTIQTKEERVKLVFAVKIALENKDLTLKPGMPADAEIIIGAVK